MGISFEDMKSKMKEKNIGCIDHGHSALIVNKKDDKTVLSIRSSIAGKLSSLFFKCSDDEVAGLADTLVGLCPEACKRIGIIKNGKQERSEIKRFLLFAGDDYYPSGGVADFIGGFKSREDIEQCLKRLKNSQDGIEWANVLDIVTGTKYKVNIFTFEFTEYTD